MARVIGSKRLIRKRESFFGRELRRWRTIRRRSQLELGLDAGVSSRHLSFLESGRSQPSNEMVLHLAAVLDIPLREQNLLLKAAGYAPAFRETDLGAPEVVGISRALRLILRQQDPFSAVAVTSRWDVVMANKSFATTLTQTLGRTITPMTSLGPPRPNMLRLLFDPRGLRSQLTNWDVVARAVLSRAYREAQWNCDVVLGDLVRELASLMDPPWRPGACLADSDAVIPIEVRNGDQTFRFFNTITTLGTPMDITLQELRIEVFHPADEATDRFVRAQENR